MAEDQMMTPADIVAKAMSGEHGDLLRDAVALRRAGRRLRGRARRAAGGRAARADHAGPAEHPGRALPAPAGRGDRAQATREHDRRASVLAIGPGAEAWLLGAAAAGASRVRRKSAEAVDLAKLPRPARRRCGAARRASAGRFADGDLAAILAHQTSQGAQVIELPVRGEQQSLQRSTTAWEGFGA